MLATITYIELKGPLRFFALSRSALKIVRQLKTTQCQKFKKQGIWTTLSGAHLEAMKISKEIAKEIRTITIETTVLPNWKEGKRLLEGGKVIKY